MYLCSGQTVVPRRVAIVKVCAGITGDVLTMPPEVEMQLIGMTWAGVKLGTTQHSPGPLTSHQVEPGMREIFPLMYVSIHTTF
jgi:hypothetical protein